MFPVRRNPLPYWVAAPALFLAASVLVTAAHAGPVGATVTALDGQAEVVPPNSTTATPAHVGTRVTPGSTIRTQANGRVELQFDDRSILRLDHSSQIQILSAPTERGVMVALGKIWAKVQSIVGVSKFQVKTPTVVAGVRGTIIRAEVIDGEAEVAVDEGEVEITTPGRPVPIFLRQNMLCRVRQGAPAPSPAAFDPRAREQWEFWTDPLVQQQIAEIEESVAEKREAAAQVHEQARSAFQTLALDGAAVKRLGQSIRAADQVVRSVAMALGVEQPSPPPGPGGPARRPGGPMGRPPGPPPAKPELLARLDAAARVYADALPVIERGRQTLREHTRDLKDLRDKLAAHQEAEKDLVAKLQTFKAQRDADPHWTTFKPCFDRCEGHRLELRRACQGAAPLLSPDLPPKLGDDPQLLPNIQARYHWAFQMLDVFERHTADGQQMIARLRGMLGP
jgi:hypothetical protein